MKTVYIIGYPGAGKTTLLAEALALVNPGVQTAVEHDKPIPHVRIGQVWTLGRLRDPFGGTDTLAMNINPKACDWVVSLALALTDAPVGHCDAPAVLVGEGDRLANQSFFAACNGASVATGGTFTLVWLDTPVGEARARASIRARSLGKPEQDASWWKGRVTKVSNLVNSRPVIRLDGTRFIEESAAHLAALLTP